MVNERTADTDETAAVDERALRLTDVHQVERITGSPASTSARKTFESNSGNTDATIRAMLRGTASPNCNLSASAKLDLVLAEEKTQISS